MWRMPDRTPIRPFRSRDWFADPARSDMTALYLERFMNYGVTPAELQDGRPIIGIAQTGSDLSPCNRIHVELAKRVRDGIRDAGGIPMEFSGQTSRLDSYVELNRKHPKPRVAQGQLEPIAQRPIELHLVPVHLCAKLPDGHDAESYFVGGPYFCNLR